MSPIVAVKPELLKWARQRVEFKEEDLARALKISNASTITQWETTGELKLSQLEKIAKKTYTPIGYMFLSSPPVDNLPIPDFRTLASSRINRPSPNLLDTVYDCQLRQDWFRDTLIHDGAEPIKFVGSVSTQNSPSTVADSIRRALYLDKIPRTELSSWEQALQIFVEKIEEAGIIVMRNGVVGNNTRRKLDVKEFRGFCLSDEYAPLIFINSTDAKTAQMFTLAHELAHIWIGKSGVSNATIIADQGTETFCNKVAAEVLIPKDEFVEQWRPGNDLLAEVLKLARLFKVSSLVVLIRAYQEGYIDNNTFTTLYDAEISKSFVQQKRSGGGDFYRTQRSRLSKRFVSTVVASTLEGRVTYSEAFRLLGVKKSQTFQRLTESIFSK